MRSATLVIKSYKYTVHITITTPDNQVMKHLVVKDLLSEEENRVLQRDFSRRFAGKIREVRKSKQLTQEEVAEKAGLHYSYYGHIELCRFRPSLFVAWKIAKALEVSLNEIIDF